MLRSLRFRLPALFLVGIVVSGVIATLVALALFQNYARQQLLAKLRREADGLTAALRAAGDRGERHGRADASVRAAAARARDRRQDLLRRRATSFPDQVSGLRQLPQNSVDWRSGAERARSSSGRPASIATYLAVAAAAAPRARQLAVRRARRRDAEDGDHERPRPAGRTPRARLRRRHPRGGPARLVPLAADHAPRRSRSRRRRTRSRAATTTSTVPEVPGRRRDRAPRASASARWRRGWATRSSRSATS